MHVSRRGVDLIKEFEGLKLTAYTCPAGKPTIGWGHTKTVNAADVQTRRTITLEQAEKLLMQDLHEFRVGVLELLKREANQHQFDAFVSLAFNIGLAAFARSTALRRHNEGRFDEAAAAIEMWNKITNPATGKKEVSRGLVRRRAAEKALYLLPDQASDDMPQEVADEAKLSESRTMRGGAVAGAATLAAVVADAVEKAEPLAVLGSDAVQYAFAAFALMGIGAMLYARIDDWRRGRR